jgi:hypothetical protein
MIDRRSRLKAKKFEEQLSAARKKHDERQRQSLREMRRNARLHAIAVAAIVTAGQPRIDEPLSRAWARALQHYGIDDKNLVAASHQLLPKIIGDGNEASIFAELFGKAPAWLLQFTAMALDARLLKFDLAEVSGKFRWGSVGYEEARRWPSLPQGTISAGDAIPDADPRQLWIAVVCMITVPIPDDEEIDRINEKYRVQCEENPHLQDLLLCLELEEKPESEWSPYERRCMRRLLKRISCPSEW